MKRGAAVGSAPTREETHGRSDGSCRDSGGRHRQGARVLGRALRLEVRGVSRLADRVPHDAVLGHAGRRDHGADGDKRGPRVYFDVDDINAADARVGELGGTSGEALPVPSMGWFAVCKDSEGNEFGLWQNDPNAPGRVGMSARGRRGRRPAPQRRPLEPK